MGRKLRAVPGLWLLATCLLAATVSIARAQEPAQAASEEGAPNANEVTIPEGTEFKLQLHSSINSKSSKPGDRVMTTLLDPVDVEDQDVLPKGLRIDGHVGEVKAAGRRGKGGFLTVVFDTVELPNGEKVAILGSLTEVFSSASGGSANVGAEGELKGRGPSRKKQAAMIVVPAAAGAAAGVGPGIAAAAGGIVAAMVIPKGKEAGLAAGSLVGMRLDRDVTINLPQTPPPAGSKSQ